VQAQLRLEAFHFQFFHFISFGHLSHFHSYIDFL
jgi:hypothetical protein